MPLIEHLLELRSRLFKACIGIVLGTIVSLVFVKQVLAFLERPYDQAARALGMKNPGLQILAPTDLLVLELKIALYVGLLIAAPIWLYQLWSFITPGLHKNERRWAYSFVAVASPLFFGGAVLAYFVISRGLEFLLPSGNSGIIANLELSKYIDFVTGMMVLFGCGFEFPLIVVMLNFAGLISARRLLSWWRVSIFVMFLFAAVVTPTPDPFGMTALALPMTALYFLAVGVAFAHDRRKAKAAAAAGFGNVSDDEASPITYDLDEIDNPDTSGYVDTVRSTEIEPAPRRRYDDDAT
ncbi:twin-arginine translocase subunit TatC [Fodinicola feengrottensis]|uniref:Sec-independent protein translocase protein TatC n=1 Tax=Fodinicola feengrottensis TaxID=435914 RepID=A0ABN2HX29_9ACTN